MKKRKLPLIMCGIVIVLLIVIGIIFIRGSFSKTDEKYVKSPNAGDISRYQWVEMLDEQAGITEYESQTPFFTDVNGDNKYFAYVQSAVEWGILDNSSDFEGDGYASGRFIALTAMKTIGEDKLQIYLGTEDAITEDTYIELAIEHELIKEKELSQIFSKVECKSILEKLNSLYFGEFWKEDIEKVEYQDGVVELVPEDILQKNQDDSEIIVADGVLSSLSEGTIIVFEHENTGLKVARKIVSIGVDGTLSLSDDVELDVILDSLVVSDITEVSIKNIINYYGLKESVSSADNMNYTSVNQLNYIPTFSTEMQSKGFKISVSTEEDGEKKILTIKVTDNDSGISYLLPIQKTVDENSEYQAEVNVDKIFVASQMKYQASTGVQYADVAIDTHTTFNGSAKKEVSSESERILLCETPAPLGSGIVGVDIQIYLVISAEGTITLEAELPMTACVRYEKEKGIRNFKQDVSVEEPILQANCEASLMLRAEPTLVIFMCANVIDTEVDMGASANAEVVERPTSQICAEVSASFPVIKISVGGDDDANTIVGELGLSREWEIISSENAPYHIGLHYEYLPDGKSQFVEKCTYNEAEDEKNENSDTDSGVNAFYGYNLPLVFALEHTDGDNDNFVFSISDEGSYYLVKGSLICPECVATDILDDAEIGEHFETGSGRGYTVSGRESYNNDQREKIILSGDDGQTYEVVNLPAFSMDAYMGTPYYVITSEDGTNYQTVFEHVTVQIDYETIFTDGKSAGGGFDSAVKGGNFEDIMWEIAYDIHFSEYGTIDILTPSDVGSNGVWGGSGTEVWK